MLTKTPREIEVNVDAGKIIGVGVIVCRADLVLLGKRKGSHGTDTWSFPGGLCELDETIEQSAIRETLEETGLSIRVTGHVGTVENSFATGKIGHHKTFFVKAQVASGDLQLMEPDKFEKWEWFAWNALPQPLLAPIVSLLEQGYSPT